MRREILEEPAEGAAHRHRRPALHGELARIQVVQEHAQVILGHRGQTDTLLREQRFLGGVAARAHGSARITQDVDLAYSRTDETIARLVAALTPFQPYLRGANRGLPFEWSVATVRAGLNFTLTTTIGDIDLIGEITGGGTYEELLPHTIEPTVFGRPLRILDLPWLIRVKRAAGRPKDLEVIAQLEALQEEIDRERPAP